MLSAFYIMAFATTNFAFAIYILASALTNNCLALTLLALALTNIAPAFIIVPSALKKVLVLSANFAALVVISGVDSFLLTKIVSPYILLLPQAQRNSILAT
jgi:hypothetical protein